MLSILKESYRSLVGYIFRKKSEIKFELVAVNTLQNKVTLRLLRKSVLIQMRFSDIIGDIDLLESISPFQASLIGGCYGRYLRKLLSKQTATKKAKTMNFSLSNKQSKYKIIYQNRGGTIGYIDQKSTKEFVEHPLVIVKNQHIISKFNSSEACYIGILAGICLEKAVDFDKKFGTNKAGAFLKASPKLRVVK